MPKLPLDRETLKLLPGLAIDALRHPRRTITQVVNGSINLVGHLLERRQVSEPVSGTGRPPQHAAEPAAAEETVEDTVDDLAPGASNDSNAETVETVDASVDDEGPADVHPEGPAPHMPPRIAGDVERDYEEDIPGITGHRER